MSNQREITYSTGETSELTGASQKQIRYWEGRGYISAPIERNVCGDIAYSRRKNNYVRDSRYGQLFMKRDRLIPLIDRRNKAAWPHPGSGT